MAKKARLEPYRYLDEKLRARLMAIWSPLEARLKGEKLPKPAGSLHAKRAACGTLYARYQSAGSLRYIIATAKLPDTPAMKCFWAYRYAH